MNIAKPPIEGPKSIVPKCPILIVLGYWDGDHDTCREVVDLMVDMQQKHAGDKCKVWLVNRQDAKPDKDMAAKLRTRFNTYTMTATSPLRGYPGGANGMFGTTAIHIANGMEVFSPWLWMEPDCVPMRPTWWQELQQEWLRRPQGIHIIGWKGDCSNNGTGWHINGGALYDQQIARIMPCVTTCDGIPWDYHCRAQMLSVAQETNLIHLCWRARNAQPSIFKEPWAMCHGYKDRSLLDLVRKKYVKKN